MAGCFPYVSGGVFPISVSGCVSRLYRVCIHVYQGVSWATRYTLIRPSGYSADTRGYKISTFELCIRLQDTERRQQKQDRVRISDVSTSVSGIVSAIMYLSVSVVCIVLYLTAYLTLWGDVSRVAPSW